LVSDFDDYDIGDGEEPRGGLAARNRQRHAN
jgi:hypothetical protein